MLRCRPSELAAWREAAELEGGMELSAWLRRAANETAADEAAVRRENAAVARRGREAELTRMAARMVDAERRGGG